MTATDLVLTMTERLRQHGVVGKFIEFFGPGLGALTVADRGTMSNMSPEFGATASTFPVDGETLRYLRDTGRTPEHVDLVERYTKEQGLFRTGDGPEPVYTETLDFDLSAVEPSLAGPAQAAGPGLAAEGRRRASPTPSARAETAAAWATARSSSRRSRRARTRRTRR